MRKCGERGTGEPDPGKEMILTRGSGRAVRGEGDAHGLNCGRLTSGPGCRRVRVGALAWARASGSAGRFGPSGAGQAEERLGRPERLGREKKKKREVMGRTGFGV